jgi:manganese/zinc/iron transport system permease protein
MTSIQLETTLLVVAVAAACAVPGVFLVLRRLALVGDAISHVLLFGIVVAYFVVRDLDSPWLMAGAAASGVLTVALVEMLQRTRLVKEDAAIALVFPALFAAGTLLASMFFRQTHLDVDQVLLGNAEFVFQTERLHLGSVYLGRRPTLVLAGLFVVNAGLVAVFYKELKLSTFDPALAAALGFWPGALHYGLMSAVSLTTVAAFDAVGPVLVVAFLVVPAAAAYLLTDRLSRMLALSVLIGAAGAVGGVMLAFRLDTNIAGTVATVLGLIFGAVFLAAPNRGLVAQVLRRWRQRREFLVTMLAIHLLHHEGTAAESDEARTGGLHRHLSWTPALVADVVSRAERAGVVTRAGELLKLTPAGRQRAREVLAS